MSLSAIRNSQHQTKFNSKIKKKRKSLFAIQNKFQSDGSLNSDNFYFEANLALLDQGERANSATFAFIW